MSADPLRVAIVGSGPAGFYAATELLRRDANACVDMFERLPVPGGLARYGVSPDHAERRQVIEHYARLAVASRRFRLRGNVEVGRHLDHAELQTHFHALVYASGAAGDRRLDIPGEDLPGSHSATEFVAWYNDHPDLAHREFRLDGERAVVIGNGNVALDVARMLLLSAGQLRATDVADRALAALSASQIREVVVLGRRGPAQAAFTVPELVGLAELDDVDVAIDCPPGLLEETAGATCPLRLQLLREFARRRPRAGTRRLLFKFLASPLAVIGGDRTEAVQVVRNRLLPAADGAVRAEPTGEVETLRACLLLRSVGYRVIAPPPLPFDARTGRVPNDRGRVANPAGGLPLAGVYVAGWLKRGPSGVIGSNKHCSHETVDAVLDDRAGGRLTRPNRSSLDLDALLADRRPAAIGYGDWRRALRDDRMARSARDA